MNARREVYECYVHGWTEACELYEAYDWENDRPHKPTPVCPVFSGPDSYCGLDLNGPFLVEPVAPATTRKEHS